MSLENIPVGIYLVKVNNRNTRTRCEICSKLTIKTPEPRQCYNKNRQISRKTKRVIFYQICRLLHRNITGIGLHRRFFPMASFFQEHILKTASEKTSACI